MKWFKKFVYLLGSIILIAAFVSGYFMYKEHSLKRQLDRAKIYYENGDIVNAVNILEQIYNKSPRSNEGKEAICLLAKCYLNIGEIEKSFKFWSILLEQDKEEYGDLCLFNLAEIAKETNKKDIAVKNYEQIINDYPDSDLADDARLNLALVYKDSGKLQSAQKELTYIVENFPDSGIIDTVEKELGNVNVALLFSPDITEGATEYIVKNGDSLFIIAQNFATTVDFIKKCNKLKSDFIKPGDKLKIIKEKFSIIVDKSKNILTLKAGEKVIKTYSVGTGISGSTPSGTYTITNKLVNPPWYKPGEGVIPFGDSRNVLGTRWLGLNIAGYGIHGTWEPDSIGKQSSAGCVRLVNEDVEELFEIIPAGTEVTVIE